MLGNMAKITHLECGRDMFTSYKKVNESEVLDSDLYELLPETKEQNLLRALTPSSRSLSQHD